MKKYLFLILSLLITMVMYGTTTTITTTAGNLSTDLGANLTSTDTLIVSGTINAVDFQTMRDDMTALAVVDLSGASIDGNVIPQNAFYNNGTATAKISLKAITLPSTITTIGENAFQGCAGLTEIAIPTSVTAINNSAFLDCNNLTTITGFDGVVTISDFAFNNCGALTNFSFPSTLVSIETYAFSGTGLKTVILNEGLTHVAARAFLSCTSVDSISIPSTLDSLNQEVFSLCHKLTSFHIPSTLTYIGPSAFTSSGLQDTLIIPSTVTKIEGGAFSGCSKLTYVSIPTSIDTLKGSVFANCSGLTSLTIPSSVTCIESWAFNECDGLKGTLTIPSSVKNIAMFAFYGCDNLTSLIIPSTVTKIEGNAFSSVGYADIYAYRNSPLTIETAVFDQVDKTTCTLHVPYGTKTKYNGSTGWKDFTKIVEMDGVTLWTDSAKIGASQGDTASIKLSANVNWSASSNESWLSVNPTTGNSNGKLVFTAQANTTNKVRTATVTISATGIADQTVTIVQASNQYYITTLGAGSKDGSSWDNAFPATSLQTAINTIGTSGQIWVAKGTYTLTSSLTMKDNVAIYGGFAGTETSLAERNVAIDTTTLLGSGISYVINNPTTLQATAVLDGFTITGNSGGVTSQGGLFNKCTITGCKDSYACGVQTSTGTFTNCNIINNYRGVNSDGAFINCNISDNVDYNITLSLSKDSVINCLIANSNDGVGYNSNGVFINSTIVGCTNTGLNNFVGSLINCIVWGNSNNWIDNATITYSALQQSKTGTDNIILSATNTDATGPQFVDPANGNYHLLASSPLINKGLSTANTSTTDINGNPRIYGSSIDLGAYEHGINVNVTVLGSNSIPVAYAKVTYNGVTYTTNSNGIATFDVVPNLQGSFTATSPYYSDTVISQFNVINADISVSVSFKNKKTASILYVNTTGTGKGTSWADALPADSLQYAINNVKIPGQVWVAKGTYTLSKSISMRNDVAVYGGFAGIETSLNEKDIINNATIISGTTIENVINNTSATLLGSAILDGFTLNGGISGTVYSLGGLFNNCTISGTNYGIITSTGTFTNCTISGNYGAVNSGAGTFTNCNLLINSSNNYGGCVSNSTGTFTNCTIKNSGSYGSGINSSTATFTNCTISGGINGGTGVSNSQSVFTNCIISGSNNGIWLLGTFINCNITGNTTGLWNFSGTLTNCIVWGNTNNSVNNPTITYTAMPGVVDGNGNIDLATNNTDGDGPQFVDPTNGDYHLSANSTLLINAGLNTANTSTTDIEGKQRIIGSAIDLGAYERGIDVTLTVLGSDSKPVTNAIVAYNGNSYKTNSNGIAVINIATGDIAFTVTSVDYTDTIKTSLTVTAALSKIVSFTTLRQDVQITVLGVDKKPLVNATVSFDKKSFTTNSKGIVTIENVAQGTHSFYATSVLYSDTATSSVTVANAEVFDTVQLYVLRQNVNITITDATSKPLNNAIVTFNKTNYTTNNSGTVILTNIATGTYSFAASSVYYTDTVKASFTVTNTEVFDTIKLVAPKPVTIIRFTKNGAGTKDGSSWANAAAMTTLQTKINTTTQPAQVWVKAGTYSRTTELEMRELISIYGGFAGTETNLNERDVITNLTTFDGGSSVNYLIYNNTELPATAIFDGFTLTKGSTGGIYSLGGTFINCIITANTNYGVASSTGTFENCTITANPLGIEKSTGTFLNCTIAKNTGTGIDGGSGTFTNCTITENENGIYGGSGVFTNCIISKQISYGISTDDGSYTNCTITGNDYGIYASAATLTNCTITDNTSGVQSGSGTFTNCTITNGIFSSAGSFTNCIVWNETNSFAMFSSVTYTAITDGHDGTGNINLSAINNDATGPHFINPTTGNYHLAAGSPLINAGLSSVNTTTTDLDGKARIIGSSIDMGAYEHGIDINVTVLGVDDKPLTNATVIYNKTTYPTNSNGIASFDVMPNSTGSFAATSKYYTDTVIGSFTVVSSEIAKTVKLTTLKPATVLRITTDGAGTKNGSSWDNALPADSLQSAINKVSIPGQIWVAKGTYSLSKSISTRNDVAVYGGFAGTEDELSKRNVTVNSTVLNGNKTTDYIINNTDSVNLTARLDGFTITKAMYGGVTSKGGLFANCTITKDSTYGVYTSTGTFVNCTVSNNQYGIYKSSGIFTNNTILNSKNYGVAYSSGTFTNCIITGNSDGVNNSSGKFTNCSIVNNTNMGIYSESGTFTNCILWGNPSNEYIGNLGVLSYSATSAVLTGTGNITLASSNSATSGPHFVNPSTGDFHLATGSPCINTGLSSANITTTDFEGNQRIVGSSIDMGAYERGLYVNVNVTVNGSDAKPLANAILNYKGNNYTTNGNGIASFEVIANSTGLFTVTSNLYSDTIKSSYTAATSDVPVTVAFTAPYLNVSIQVNGSDNLLLTDAIVKYNGESFTANTNGVVTLKVKANTTGSFTVTSESHSDTVKASFTVVMTDISETVSFKTAKPNTIIASNELVTTELFTKWYQFMDKNDGGSSTIDFSKTTPGANGTNSMVQAVYVLSKGNNKNSPYIGFGFNTMVDSAKSIDFSSASGVSFYHKGASCTFSILVPQNIDPSLSKLDSLATTKTVNYDYYHVTVPAHTDWTNLSYSWNNFAQFGWGAKYNFDISKAYRFEWQITGSTGNSGTYAIDEVALKNIALPLLSVSTNKATVAATAGSKTIAYLCTNTSWTAISDQTWLTVNSTSGQLGYAILTFTAAVNTGITRTATVTVSAGGKTQFITITQLDASVALTVSSTSVSAKAAKGSTATVIVTSNMAWTATSDEDACTVSPSSGSAGTTTVTFTAGEENTTTSSRSATVIFNVNGITYQTVTVTQEAATTEKLTVSSETASIAATASSTAKVNVTSNTNTSWAATSSDSWLTVITGDESLSITGETVTALTFTATVNTTTSVRSAIVTIKTTGGITKIVTVTQQAPVNNKPVVSTIASQSISGSEMFNTIQLSNYVTDVETPANSIIWSASKSDYLTISIVGGVASIVPATLWNGTETIKFIAKDAQGATDTAYVEFSRSNAPGSPTGKPTGIFTVEKQIVSTGTILPFSLNTIGASSYLWTFDGGLPATSQSANPNVTYNKPGTYSVTLTLQNNNGTTDIIKTDYITIMGIKQSDTVICKSKSITISLVNATSADSVKWNNGSTATSLNLTPLSDTSLTVIFYVGLFKYTSSINIGVAQPVSLGQISADGSICVGTSQVLSPGSYVSYLWQDASTTTTYPIDTKNAKMYSVTVTDKYGCTSSDAATVKSIKPLPVTGLAKTNTVCDKSSISLAASGGDSYVWIDETKTKLSTNSSLSVSKAGKYIVSVTGANGCIITDTTTVEVLRPYKEQIGVVTYDTLYGKKVIIAWNRHDNQRTERYVLYRDNGKNGWDSIAGIPFNKASIVVDSTANLEKKAYRYKLVTIDETCHNQDSSIHRTIHVSPLLRADGGIDIQWNTYIGYTAIAYSVIRYNPDGTTTKITDQSGDADILTVTDQNPIKGGIYRVLYNLPESINPTLLKSDSGPFSQSLSNMAESELTDIGIKDNEQIKLNPNPASNFVTVTVSSQQLFSVELIDLFGHIITVHSGIGSIKLDCSCLTKGVYFVKINSENGVITKPLICE